MTTYYELLSDGTVGQSTPFETVARDLNLPYTTEKEIVYGYDGKRYISGDEPTPSIDYQNEQIRIQRQHRYQLESDPLRLDYDEALARGEDTAEQLKQKWLASKDKIRKELPYIEEENNE